MNTELTTATANRINELHQSVIDGVKASTDAIHSTMSACIEIGGHLEQIPRGIRMAWLRDNCPGISHEQIAAYLSIAKTAKKRPDNAIDHRFFALLGMTEERESYQKPTKGIAPNWLAWTGKLTGYFTMMTKENPIEKWNSEEREAVAAQLRPIAELYQNITRHH